MAQASMWMSVPGYVPAVTDYIDRHKNQFGVEPICAVLKDVGVPIAPSTYYATKTRPPSDRWVRDVQITAATIRTVTEVHSGPAVVVVDHHEPDKPPHDLDSPDMTPPLAGSPSWRTPGPMGPAASLIEMLTRRR
jgi:hypothetical protein